MIFPNSPKNTYVLHWSTPAALPKKAMRSSPPSPKFLVDENVKAVLARLLKKNGFDVKTANKGEADSNLSEQSKNEKRILITNDSNFFDSPADEIYSVVILNLPQNDTQILLDSVTKLIEECKHFEGNLIIINHTGWKSSPLIIKIKL